MLRCRIIAQRTPQLTNATEFFLRGVLRSKLGDFPDVEGGEELSELPTLSQEIQSTSDGDIADDDDADGGRSSKKGCWPRPVGVGVPSSTGSIRTSGGV